MNKFVDLLSVCIFVWSLVYFANSLDNPLKNAAPYTEKDESLILLWTKPRTPRIFSTYLFENLEQYYSTCFVTNDRERLPFASVVIFSLDDFDHEDLPKGPRDPTQLWVLFSIETVNDYFVSKHAEIGDTGREFNLTASYSKQSDIIIENSPGLRKRNATTQISLDKDEKVYLIADVRGCEHNDWREEYVQLLNKSVRVTPLGQSNEVACYETFIHRDIQSLSANYYYLLLFERNACSTEAIIKDLWHILNADIVPIVYGALNYSEFMPPGSYIDATNRTPEDVAEQAKNSFSIDGIYQQFFRWRMFYEPLKPKKAEPAYQLFTKVCSILDQNTTNLHSSFKSKTIEQFQEELLSSQKSNCALKP